MFNPDEMDYEDEVNNFNINNEEDDDDDKEEDDDDKEEDDGISFEKYVELRTKMDPFGDNKDARYKIAGDEGYTREDWDFYENVWTIEMANPDRQNQFSELYALYSKKN